MPFINSIDNAADAVAVIARMSLYERILWNVILLLPYCYIDLASYILSCIQFT